MVIWWEIIHQALKKFCKELNLICPSCTPNIPTYHPYTQSHKKSHIDMFLTRRHETDVIKNVNIERRHGVNTSPHYPVIAEITFEINDEPPKLKQNLMLQQEWTGQR